MNFPHLKKGLPVFDQTVGALIEDLGQRGLYERVLVVAVGAFGCTPRITTGVGNPGGRDHWPHAFSALLAGGGIAPGQILGATDRYGERPSHRPVSPTDLLATIYSALGIDPHATVLDQLGRPMPILPDGQPIVELFS
jgi:uncharacterized protein (DUF1501 family)